MPTPESGCIWADLGLQGATSAVKEFPCPVNGTIEEVWVGAAVLATTSTVAVAKIVGATSVNVLTATNVAQSDMSAGVAAKQTLATASATKRVAAGDILKATWTITSAGSFVGGSCLVKIKPDVW